MFAYTQADRAIPREQRDRIRERVRRLARRKGYSLRQELTGWHVRAREADLPELRVQGLLEAEEFLARQAEWIAPPWR